MTVIKGYQKPSANGQFCKICGKEILPGEICGYAKSRRGSENYFHVKCFNETKYSEQDFKPSER